MSILVNKKTRVICQGITGKAGVPHQGLPGLRHENGRRRDARPRRPGFRRPAGFRHRCQAVEKTGANATMIFVPPPFAADAIMEAADAGIRVIVAITEGIPVLDMVRAAEVVRRTGVRLVGPNCPGIITPGECKIGIMPGYIHRKGAVGVMSRSGTLTYEAVWQLTDLGLANRPASASAATRSSARRSSIS